MVGAFNADAEHSIATQIKIARVFYFLIDPKSRWGTPLICTGSGICFDAWPTTPSRRLHVHGEPCRERRDSHSLGLAKF